MKACIYILCLLLPAQSRGAERLRDYGAVLTREAATPAGKIRNRSPAAIAAATEDNRSLFERLKPGQFVIVQNSIADWDDKVATVVDKFEDGSVRVELSNGQKAFVKAGNLAATLSPETDCGESNGTKICKGDVIFYPIRTSSLDIPEAPAAHIFENGSVVVQDGGEFVFDLKQVGKIVDCSPQKESICTGSYVYAQAYRGDKKFDFEGPVEKTYSNGVALVRVNTLWRYPIDVTALNKRIETAKPADRSPAAILPRNHRGPNLPYTVTEELEPLDPSRADRILEDRY